MITSLIIKKKYLYSLIVSFILSVVIAIVFTPNPKIKVNDNLSNGELLLSCSSYQIKVEYNYGKFLTGINNSLIHNFIKFSIISGFEDEIKSKKIIFDGITMYFIGTEKACKNNYEVILIKFSKVIETAVSNASNLKSHIIYNNAELGLNDEALFYTLRLSSENYPQMIEAKSSNVESTTKDVQMKFILIFLMSFLAMNVSFYLINNISIKID